MMMSQKSLDSPKDEPCAGDPVGVELVGRHRLEKLLFVLCHETRVNDVVEGGEPLLHCGRDGPFETRMKAMDETTTR